MNTHFELNGTKGWVFSFALVVILQSVAFGMWMGRVETKLDSVNDKTSLITQAIKEEVKTNKQDIRDLANKLYIRKEQHG